LVKGITRRIVEIKETGSGYFERAIFFVRMDAPQNLTESTLTKEASHIIDRFCNDLKFDRNTKKYKALDILKLMAAAVGGALAAFIILKFAIML